MTKYSESELYAIFSNIGYELNSGKTLEEVEKEIKEDYGLDIELDRELTDSYGAIIKYKDEIIHSIRGTDSFMDVIADLNLMSSHPYYKKILSTGFAGLSTYYRGKELLDYLVSETTQNPEFYKNEKTDIINSYYKIQEMYQVTPTRDDIPLPPRVTLPTTVEEELRTGLIGKINPEYEEWDKLYGQYFNFDIEYGRDHGEMVDKIKELNEKIKKVNIAQTQKYTNTLAEYLALSVAPIIITGIMEDLFGISIKKDRFNKEFLRNDRATFKYPKMKMSLTGHSLGAIANDIGREYNIKTVTFNPAPMEHNKQSPHSESKIYRIKNDIVSHFLTDSDSEEIIEIPKYSSLYDNIKNFMEVHSLNNFLPKKRKLGSVSDPKPINNYKQSKVHNSIKQSYDIPHPEKPERNVEKLLRIYSALIEDSIQEFLPNYQTKLLKNKSKNKFNKKK